MWMMVLALVGCSEYDLGVDPANVDLGPERFEGGHPTRDTDGDGVPDSEDPDADGDGVLNEDDPDPDGDGIGGWTLDPNPDDDRIDLETNLPTLEEGGVRGRICAPNGSTWVAGAEVTIVTAMGIVSTTTNGEGWWQIDHLEPGTYTVLVTKGHFSTAFEATVEDGVVTDVVYEECVEQGNVRVAVVSGEYDSIGAILGQLGVQFDVVNGRNDAVATAFLEDPTALQQYDLIFFNCGMSFAWLDSAPAVVEANLRDFVVQGGSIYASDWAYLMVETPFPDQVDFLGDDLEPGAAFRGFASELDAIVVDPAMAGLLGGNSAALHYDLDAWAAVGSTPFGLAQVLLEGEFEYLDDAEERQSLFAPLAIRFQAGQGKVTYTSFHNEVQRTADMERLLEDIVLSL